MAAVVRSVALGQNIHNIMPGNCGHGPLQQKGLGVQPGNGSVLLAKRPIAPAPTMLVTDGMQLGKQQTVAALDHRQKAQIGGPVSAAGKKYAYCGLPYATPQQSASVQRRNARERNRVKQVNNGFANLRQHIPSTVVTALTNGTRATNKKLSKVDTLRLAVEYIRSLQRMLEENGGELGSGAGAMTKQQIAAAAAAISGGVAAAAAAAAASATGNTNQLSNSSVCSASSGSTYYGTMSEPSSASSPAPSHLSENSSQRGTPGCYTQISGSFKHEPYDIYIDPSNSPTPSYGSDHGIGGVGVHHHLHATTVLPGQTILGATGDNNNYILVQQQQQQQQQQHQQQQHHQQQHHHQQHSHYQSLAQAHHTQQPQVQFKTELYEDSPYDEELSPQNPDDEELLDAISWWQQQ
uniref:Uncharacterized protein n=1 Tax=Anopheles atroparvus TaxID=41427 RepID=A0A182JFG4_ANOAO